MNRRKGLFVLLPLALAFGGMAYASSDDPTAFQNGWTKLADGVFERREIDGSSTRVGIGQGGAWYDRSILAGKISSLSNKVANGLASDAEKANLDDLETELNSIPVNPSSSVSPLSSSTGWVCGSNYYALDSHFAVGKGGATPVSRSHWGFTLWGPQPPYPDVVALYARAQLTPNGGSTITVIKTGSDISLAPVAIVDWKKGIWDNEMVTSSDCSASTYTTITVSSAECKVPAFVSLTKTYPTCTGSL